MDRIGTQSAGGCKGNFPKRSKKFARPRRTGIIGTVDDKYQSVAGFVGTMPATIGHRASRARPDDNSWRAPVRPQWID
jgi:hypothetical protein